ncbi:hypothetical protein AYI69_g7718, partial [Smittium culicis]
GTLPGNNNRYYTIPYLLGFFQKREDVVKRGTLPGNNNRYYTIPYLLGFFQKREDVVKRGTLPGNNNRYYTIPYLLGYFLKREEQNLSQGAKIVKRGTLPGNNNNRYYTIPYLLGFFQKRGGENFDAEVNEHLDDHFNYSYLTSPKLLEDIVQYKNAAGSDSSDISKRGTLPGNNNNHYYTIPYLLGFFQKRQDDVSDNQVAVGSEFSASESVGAQFLNLLNGQSSGSADANNAQTGPDASMVAKAATASDFVINVLKKGLELEASDNSLAKSGISVLDVNGVKQDGLFIYFFLRGLEGILPESN